MKSTFIRVLNPYEHRSCFLKKVEITTHEVSPQIVMHMADEAVLFKKGLLVNEHLTISLMASKVTQKLPCKLADLSIDITLNCGQSFRWKKRPSGEWLGVFAGYLWILSQDKDFILYETIKPKKLEASFETDSLTKQLDQASNEPCKILLEDYLQLRSPDLPSLYEKWSMVDANFGKVSPDFPGVRMLRQDPVENLFCFICSSNNNIQRITTMVEKMCQTFGRHLLVHDNIEYYDFPTIETLANDEVEPKLRTLGFGYRAKFIRQSAVKILEKGGKDWLLGLRSVSYDEAKRQLMTLPGIGAKVADCICLMSLDHNVAIPVDTHVFQIAKASYVPHLRHVKSVTERVYNEISSHFQSLYGPYAGWAHSVLFSADLRHLKAALEDKKRSCHDAEEPGKRRRRR